MGEKAKIEKELRNMTKRAEKAELDLIKAESVKTVQGGSGEALFQDMLAISKNSWKANYSVQFVMKSTFTLQSSAVVIHSARIVLRVGKRNNQTQPAQFVALISLSPVLIKLWNNSSRSLLTTFFRMTLKKRGLNSSQIAKPKKRPVKPNAKAKANQS